MLSHRMRCLSFLVAFLGLATSVSAQNVSSGRITGTITDENRRRASWRHGHGDQSGATVAADTCVVRC